MKKITVVGSLAIDYVVETKKIPRKGETVQGESFTTKFGGKGANQAISAARLGGMVSMIGMVGTDEMGDHIITNLKKNTIDVSNILKTTTCSTGTAHITISENDNSIIVVGAANNLLELDLNKDENLKETILKSDIVLLQNEIPEQVNSSIINFCFNNGIKIIYNPAPAKKISRDMIDKVSYITPNEKECELLFNSHYLEVLPKFPNKLIVTIGEKGVAFNDGEKNVIVPSYEVTPVDTTGAGDTFNGALAVALTNNMNLLEAIQFSNFVASLSIQKFGAQEGMPLIEEVKRSSNYEKKWDIK